jgi:hypothetical protein
MKFHIIGLFTAFVSIFNLPNSATAETPRVMTWNINGGEQDKDLGALTDTTSWANQLRYRRVI